MNTLQDVREAHQMWEYKIKNAGRKGIVPNCGKSGSLIGILNRISANTPAHSKVSLVLRKSGAKS